MTTHTEDLQAIADAINSVPDGMALEDVPEHVHRTVVNIGASDAAADLAKALVTMSLKTSGHAAH